MRAPAAPTEVDAARRSLREATATLAWFDDRWLEPSGAADADTADRAVSDFLMADCVRVPLPGGGYGWTLNDAVRRQTIVALGDEGCRDALRRSPHRPDDAVQRALDRALLGGTPPIDPATAGADELSAELQVVRWFEGVVDGMPDKRRLEREVARRELLQPLRSLVGAGFFGREDWLSVIAAHIQDDGGQSLVISGVGGVGKSTLLAKSVLDALDRAPDMCFAYLNFDRGALEADKPARLLAEIVRQVALQAPDLGARAAALAEELLSQEFTDEQVAGLSSRMANATAWTGRFAELFDATVALLGEACPGRLLVVLDTFEEVQRQQLADIAYLWDLVAALRRRIDGLRTIVSGRALDAGLRGSGNVVVHELTELDEAAAVAMLTSQPGIEVSERLARRVFALVSGNPLSLRLAIDVLRRTDHGHALLDLSLQEGQIQGQLYRRILLHIEDPDVRKMAHPGLVVRVITPDVIRHVLAGPCEIDVPDAATAERLFAALEREATLVSSNGAELRHRADVRALMLPGLERDQKPQVDAIHRAAVDYYAGQDSVERRAEELYHRMMLGETAETLDGRWRDDAFALLRESIDELPPEGKVYLWSHSGGQVRVDPEVAQIADDSAWARATEPEALAEIRAGQAENALAIVRRRRGPSGESLLPSVEVEALEELRQFDEALTVLRTTRRSALRRGEADDAVRLSQDMLRVLERMGRFDDALADARVLRESLRAGRGEGALDFLVASTTYLRLLRRSGQGESDEYERAADEAAQVAERLQLRDLERRPGLVRELVAEIGNRSRKLLEFGIDTVGVSRGSTARLDEQLDRVESELAGEDEAPGSTSRRDVARKVTKYAQQRGLDDELSDAIAEAYRDETDDLYS